jgi:hypothetical protein
MGWLSRRHRPLDRSAESAELVKARREAEARLRQLATGPLVEARTVERELRRYRTRDILGERAEAALRAHPK